MSKKQNSKADIVDVARRAKVSASTVSRSFTHPHLVNPATRKKIDAAVKKLGYIRNRAAQSMHGRRSGTIGFIVPTIDHAIFAEVVQSFSEAVEAEGFTILMASHGYDLAREYAVLRKFLEHRVDAIALIGLEHSEDTFQLIEQQDIPALAIWNYDPASRLSCVGADNRAAGQMAAQKLIDLGHHRIGMAFPGTKDNDRARGRYDGAMSALSDAGLEVPDHWLVEVPYSISKAKQACIDLLRQDDLPTGLVCGNDVIAQGAVFAAQSLNLRVPDDLSIVGIGDFKGSEDMEPALTTIRIPARRIGITAGNLIVEMVSSGTKEIQRVKIRQSDVTRSTTSRQISKT
jgi:LacI family transcriptional regulator